MAQTERVPSAPPGRPMTPAERSPGNRWSALVVIALAQLLTGLDATIVAIALPTAQRELGFTDPDRQWIITAYTLAFAGLLLLGGRLADRIGRRQALVVGLSGFAAASALAGAAPTFGMLVAGRALQGAFAGVLAPTALSLVVVLFTDQRERGRAFAFYGAVASSGGIIGLVLGGALTEYAAWRWCLYVNVAFALLALTGALRLIPAIPAVHRTPVPLGAAVLGTAGLAFLVFGASRAASEGWSDTSVVTAFAVGVSLLSIFLLSQRGRDNALLPLWLLASRSRLTSYVAIASGVVASLGLSLMLTYHFQAVLGWSPLRSGLAFLPLSFAVAASGYLVSGRLTDRVAPQWLVSGGLGVAAAGLGVVATLSPDSGYVRTILPALVLVGLGMGGVFAPAIGVVTRGVSPRDAGIASALANTAMQIGSSLGIALLNTIAVIATRDAFGNPGTTQVRALVHGYSAAAGSAAAALAVVAVAVTALLRPATSDPAQGGHR